MYRSTPQHVIDEESHPGVLAEMLDSSSSSDTSSSSSSTDSDSSGSRTTAKRIKRVLRRKRRKSSASSKDTPSLPSSVGTPSASNFSHISHDVTIPEAHGEHQASTRQPLGAILSGDEADTDGENDKRLSRTRGATITSRDFEIEQSSTNLKSSKTRKAKKSSKVKHQKPSSPHVKRSQLSENPEKPAPGNDNVKIGSEDPHVGFAEEATEDPSALDNSTRRPPFMLRGISVARPPMPTIPRMLSTTVFSAANPTGPSYSGSQGNVMTTQALHRSNSLPSRLNQAQSTPAATVIPAMPVRNAHPSLPPDDSVTAKKHMSRTAAVIMLLMSTALVAVCAEFLVGSISHLVSTTGVSEAFIGLIVLPIVGNAAEHVTAVTVATKNKMDLAIGVAVGSSIQIALFVTPVIVLLGWILQKDTMSLYFSLFETVALFVTVFVVNFLVLDGRSNYLEGALLIAVYVIIAVATFFYPDSDEQSLIGGAESIKRLLRLV